MRSIDIVCVDAHQLGDDAMWWGGFWASGELYIASVADMVAKVKARLDEDEGSLNGELRIVGHGSESGQWFGADWVGADEIANHEKDFKELAGRFGLGGWMTLEGCGVGFSIHMMIALSKLVGVPVDGYLAPQYLRVPGYEGRLMRCYDGKARAGPPTLKDEVKRVLKKMPRHSGFGL
ncbi:MAG TPA: hypothetical protein VFH27_00550 [Longimicrobiaceae bacterium]|nr:hypothetical protein [Longimicrobiaceae bacterium]